MNIPSEQYIASGSAKVDEQGQEQENTSPESDSQHSITPKEDIEEPSTPDLTEAEKLPPAQKSASDNGVLSQQQSLPTTAGEMKGKWAQYLGSAKIAWGKLTDDEILKSEGHAQKLAGLVQERYALTKEMAEKQVNEFLKSCH